MATLQPYTVTDAQANRYLAGALRRKERWTGQQYYLDGLPLAACENEQQEVGWWDMHHAACYAEYSADAVQRGVQEYEMADFLPV